MNRKSTFTQDLLGRAPRQNSLGQKSGFTMIELVVVIAIISMLAGLLLPALNRARERAMVAKCITTIGSLQTALAMYSLDYGLYPPSTDAENTQNNGNSADVDHFAPGVDEPNNFVNALTASTLGGPYMEFKGKDLDEETDPDLPVLLDPWGQAYIYMARRWSTTQAVAANNLVVHTDGPFHPYTDPTTSPPETDSNTYNIYSLGPDKQTDNDDTNGGEIDYSAGVEWNDLDMVDSTSDECGDWNDSDIDSDNARYDDINSWDGARSG